MCGALCMQQLACIHTCVAYQCGIYINLVSFRDHNHCFILQDITKQTMAVHTNLPFICFTHCMTHFQSNVTGFAEGMSGW